MSEDKKKVNEEILEETEEAKETAEEKEADEAKTAEETSAESGDAKSPDESGNSEEQESERYIRLLAEFQNFKKRAAKEKTDIHAYANEKVMTELLPVLDNFERALETETADESYAKGMELIFQQMKTALTNHGLAEIAALGEDFDPNKHSAVMTEESDEYDSGKVCKVLQKGYELNGRVIRAAMVAVVK